MKKIKSAPHCSIRLLLFLLAAMLLAGCAPQASSSQPVSSTSGGDPAQSASPISRTSYPPFSHHYPETNSYPVPTREQMSPTVPDGPLDAITSTDELTGSWFHMTGPVIEGQKNGVYQFRFHDMSSNSIMLSYGLYETDVGTFFRGEYTIDQGGVLTATLKLSDYEVPEDTPLIHVTILAQKSAEAENLRIFTIQSIVTESEVFNDTFSQLLNVSVAYIRGY